MAAVTSRCWRAGSQEEQAGQGIGLQHWSLVRPNYILKLPLGQKNESHTNGLQKRWKVEVEKQ